MRLRLANRIPFLNRVGVVRRYSEYLEHSGFKIDATIWITVSFAVALVISGLFILVLPKIWYMGLIGFIVLLDLFIGYPYLTALQRVDNIEEILPDALKQMADTLKAGGTYEYALREIAMSEYGPLTKEMNTVLRKLEEGENFEDSLKTLSENVDSLLVRRTVTIIVDSVRAGAGLADILDQISEDVRALHRIGRERKSRTLMQALFMVAAGAVVAPIIFGFVSTIIQVLIGASAGVVSAAEQAEAIKAAGFIAVSIQVYIFIEIIATSIMISLMRDGNMSKSIIYFPILLLVAYIVYLVAQVASSIMVGGIGASAMVGGVGI